MKAIVQAPSLRRNPHGLVEAANVVESDGQWERGVTFTPRGCQAIFAHVPWCPSEGSSDWFDCPSPAEFSPYVLDLGLAWATGDMGAGPKEMLTEAFDIGTSSVLERLASSGVENVTGTMGQVPVAGTIGLLGIRGRLMAGGVAPPRLEDALDTDIVGPPDMAIGAVEAKLLDASDHIGGTGTILISPFVAAQCQGALEYEGDTNRGHLRTKATHCPVIVGNFSPPDQVFGVLGDIDVYLSPVEILEVHERSLNEWTGRAQRYAAVVWNTCAGPFRARASTTTTSIPPSGLTGTNFSDAFDESAFA